MLNMSPCGLYTDVTLYYKHLIELDQTFKNIYDIIVINLMKPHIVCWLYIFFTEMCQTRDLQIFLQFVVKVNFYLHLNQTFSV